MARTEPRNLGLKRRMVRLEECRAPPADLGVVVAVDAIKRPPVESRCRAQLGGGLARIKGAAGRIAIDVNDRARHRRADCRCTQFACEVVQTINEPIRVVERPLA
jgi:hypothetical protein